MAYRTHVLVKTGIHAKVVFSQCSKESRPITMATVVQRQAPSLLNRSLSSMEQGCLVEPLNQSLTAINFNLISKVS